MQYMNDFDLDNARARFSEGNTPNRARLAMVVALLADWTNEHSDGWAYWLPPRRAANKAMTLINSTTNVANDEQERTDATDAEVKAALTPIKAFLTRQGVDHSVLGFLTRQEIDHAVRGF
jgi:hypothetical protein